MVPGHWKEPREEQPTVLAARRPQAFPIPALKKWIQMEDRLNTQGDAVRIIFAPPKQEGIKFQWNVALYLLGLMID